jgi:hypothetical protein
MGSDYADDTIDCTDYTDFAQMRDFADEVDAQPSILSFQLSGNPGIGSNLDPPPDC